MKKLFILMSAIYMSAIYCLGCVSECQACGGYETDEVVIKSEIGKAL